MAAYVSHLGTTSIRQCTGFDDKVPLMMRHPIYVSAKESLNIGHIGDMHITARQHAYKGKEATVIPGADLKVSPFIGNTTGNNLETCLELMDSIGNPPMCLRGTKKIQNL